MNGENLLQQLERAIQERDEARAEVESLQSEDAEIVVIKPIAESCESTITFCVIALEMMLTLERVATELDEAQFTAVDKAVALLDNVARELRMP